MGNCKSNNNKKKEKIANEYFSAINKILLEKNVYNFKLIDNLKICLNEKNFDQVSNNPLQYFTYEEKKMKKEFINWLDFFYQYLSQEYSHERYWAMQMIDKLNEEKFQSECKYLSEFFTSLEEIDLATLKYNEYRNKVKKYILKFKQHIINKDHPINKVVRIFEKIWVDYAQTKINLIQQNYKDYNDKNNIKIINKQVNELTNQLQRFIVHLQISLKLFYSRTINYSCFNEEKDELINLLTTLVFRTGDIYNIVFELYKLSLIHEIDNMTNCLRKLIKIEPQKLGIFKQFCLNKQSLDYQEEILLDHLKSIENISNNDIKNSKFSFQYKSNFHKYNLKVKQNEIEKNKIDLILKLVNENKKRCPNYGDREVEETKVNLDFEENFNLISAQENIKEKELNYNVSNALLPINEIENDDVKRLYTNIKRSFSINDNNDECINNINNDISYGDLSNRNIIIRTTLNDKNDKNLINAKIEKVFNRVSFLRTKNVEYLAFPYETAIQLLKQIKKYKTPFEKMMIIASISNEITECINDFWRNLSEYIKYDLLNLGIDQLMAIFIYIIIKAQIFDISAHCKIIKSFTTCLTQASMIGYYYSTVEASVLYIQSIKNINDLFKNQIN